MNYDSLSSELIRQLRGKRSQPALSRRLGYKANVAYVWESGRRFPPVSSLFRIAACSNLEVHVLKSWLGPLAPALTVRWGTMQTRDLLRLMFEGVTAKEIAGASQVNRTTVGRWLTGATEPRIPVWLRLVDALSHRLVEFIGLLCDPASLSSLTELYRDRRAQERLAYGSPSSHLVMRAIELDKYKALARHEPGTIAALTGLSLEDEERYLKALLDAGQVKRDRAGRYRATRVLTLDTRSDPERNRRLKHHFAELSLKRLERISPDAQSLFSYNLFTASQADLARIRELHLEYYERVRRIVAESSHADHVVLLNQQLVLLDE